MSSIIGGTTGVTFPDGTTQTTAATQTNPAGSTGQVQYNNGNAFGAISSGISGQVLTSAGSGSAPSWVTPSGSATLNEFTSSGTWTKPSSATFVMVECWGAGGGGGSGSRGNGSGGGGGGGGAYTYRLFKASDLSSTETVTVGAGGAGGTSITTDDTDGNSGNYGGNSSFGTKLYAYGGIADNRGLNGSNTTGGSGGGVLSIGGAPYDGEYSGINSSNAASRGFGGGAINMPSTVPYNGPSGFGGGAGGGSRTTGNGYSGASSYQGGAGGGGAGSKTGNGAAGGSSTNTGGGGGAGGVADTSAGSAGSFRQGGGGGGGSTNIAFAGGAGGSGGGGGGGGGASENGYNSGAGGAGGNGLVRVYSW